MTEGVEPSLRTLREKKTYQTEDLLEADMIMIGYKRKYVLNLREQENYLRPTYIVEISSKLPPTETHRVIREVNVWKISTNGPEKKKNNKDA